MVRNRTSEPAITNDSEKVWVYGFRLWDVAVWIWVPKGAERQDNIVRYEMQAARGRPRDIVSEGFVERAIFSEEMIETRRSKGRNENNCVSEEEWERCKLQRKFYDSWPLHEKSVLIEAVIPRHFTVKSPAEAFSWNLDAGQVIEPSLHQSDNRCSDSARVRSGFICWTLCRVACWTSVSYAGLCVHLPLDANAHN